MNITGGRFGAMVGVAVGTLIGFLITVFTDSPEIERTICWTCLLLIAFLWLAWETQWFTIRLPYGRQKTKTKAPSLAQLVIGVIAFIVIDSLITSLVEEGIDTTIFGILPKMVVVPLWHRATVTDPITRKAIQVDRRTGRIL